MANSNDFLRSCLEILRSGYLSNIRFIAMSIVSFNGILVNRLKASYEIINLLEQIISYISLQNENESFARNSVGITGSNISV